MLTLLSTILDVPHRHKQLFHPLGRLVYFLSSSKQLSGACMTLILQWGQRVLGRGEGESLWVRLLLLQNFPTQLDRFLLSLIRLVTGANNSVLVVVSAALSFTNSSRTPFLVVASATRASKYSSRSDADLVRPFACWTWGACLSAPCTAPNWSWHATAFF